VGRQQLFDALPQTSIFAALSFKKRSTFRRRFP
jgi:hypothetical protein